MVLRTDLFRTGVAECYAKAQKAKTLEIRQAYLELTQGWRELADEVERLDRNRPKHLRELRSTPINQASSLRSFQRPPR